MSDANCDSAVQRAGHTGRRTLSAVKMTPPMSSWRPSDSVATPICFFSPVTPTPEDMWSRCTCLRSVIAVFFSSDLNLDGWRSTAQHISLLLLPPPSLTYLRWHPCDFGADRELSVGVNLIHQLAISPTGQCAGFGPPQSTYIKMHATLHASHWSVKKQNSAGLLWM